MLIELYLLLSLITGASVFITFFKPEDSRNIGFIFVAWVAFILAAGTAVSSAEIEYMYCSSDMISSYTNQTTNVTTYEYDEGCDAYSYEAVPLIWMWGGISSIMLVLAIIDTLLLTFDRFRHKPKLLTQD